MKNDEFLVITLKHVSGLRVVVNHPRTLNLCAIAHENSHKTRKHRVLGHISRICNGSYRHANPLGTQKLWAINHENGHKHENDKFLVITLKHVSGRKVAVNRPGTPKLRAIAHENGHKTRKKRVSSLISQTCKGSYEACKSAWNPKTMGNNS